jgi:hypothetical protein
VGDDYRAYYYGEFYSEGVGSGVVLGNLVFGIVALKKRPEYNIQDAFYFIINNWITLQSRQMQCFLWVRPIGLML